MRHVTAHRRSEEAVSRGERRRPCCRLVAKRAGSERKREHMWRLMYAAVSPLAVGRSEVDDVSVECETQVPLRSPPGAVNFCTRASASFLTPALVDGALERYALWAPAEKEDPSTSRSL